MLAKILGSALLLGTVLASAAAQAAGLAVATTDVNLRAGPSTAYPAVDVVPYGDTVRVYGCLSSRSWCDVSFAGERGWMSSNYIAFVERGRRYVGVEAVDVIEAPVISFSFGNYWDNYYRDRPFYRERNRWAERRWDDGSRYERRLVERRYVDRDRRGPDGWDAAEDWRRDDGWRGERRDERRWRRRNGGGEDFYGSDDGVSETELRRPRGWQGD